MKRRATVVLTSLLLVLVMATSAFAIPITVRGGDTPKERLEFLMQYIEEGYYEEVEEELLYEAAYKALFEALDQHSVYYNEEELEAFNIDSTGTYGGIGVQVTMENGYVTVISPFDGTPGDRAGILPGDQIVEVDGVSVEGQALDMVANKMRGEPGTVLKLGVKRRGAAEIIQMEITREVITVHPVTYEVLEEGMGYLRLSTFNEHAFKEVAAALTKNGDRPLIVDLRNNPGGFLDQVIKIADLFLPKGAPILTVDYRAREDQSYIASVDMLYKGETVVLINEGSASASEILAGALKENNRATILGTTSYGKGTVQNLIELSDGSGVKMTIAEYLVGRDVKIDGVGVSPTVDADVDEGFYEQVENLQPFVMEDPLERGSVGIDVYAAQERLALLGYELSVDGLFGSGTEGILKTFEEERGITVDGILEDETERELNTAIREQMADQVLKQAIDYLQNN